MKTLLITLFFPLLVLAALVESDLGATSVRSQVIDDCSAYAMVGGNSEGSFSSGQSSYIYYTKSDLPSASFRLQSEELLQHIVERLFQASQKAMNHLNSYRATVAHHEIQTYNLTYHSIDHPSCHYYIFGMRKILI